MRPTKSILIALTLTLLGPAPAALSANEDWVAVIHPPPVITKMSPNEARAIFSMRVRAWPDGSAIRVFVLPDASKEHQAFIRNQLKLLPHQLKRNWERMVYTGIGKAPTTANDEQQMLKLLLNNPGSIGYLPRALVQEREELNEIPLQ